MRRESPAVKRSRGRFAVALEVGWAALLGTAVLIAVVVVSKEVRNRLGPTEARVAIPNASDDRKWLSGARYLRPSECRRVYGYDAADRLIGCLVPGYRDPDDPRRNVNGRGFYGEELGVPKPAGTFRIVCLGGSTTEAGYCEALARRIDAANRGPWRFEVVNGGVLAYDSAADAVRWFHDVAGVDPRSGADLGRRSLEPDLVILYSGWNDFLGCQLFSDPERDVLARFHRSGDHAELARLTRAWFASHVAWIVGQRDTLARIRDDAEVHRWRAAKDDAAIARDLAAQLGAQADPDAIRRWLERDDLTPADLDQRVDAPSSFDDGFPFEPFASNLERVLRDARSRGVRTAVATLAEAYGCGPYRALDCGSYLLAVNDRAAIVHHVVNPAIRRIAAHEGATLVDFERGVRAREDRCALFFDRDELHYDEHGREVLAELAFDALRSELPLVPDAVSASGAP